MDKEILTSQAVDVLNRAGFMISARCLIRPRSFDLAARKGEFLLLIKILSNIDGLNEHTALEIRRLAKYLMGSPLLIGEKTRDQPLERGAVYNRYGVPTVNVETMDDLLLNSIPPLVYAAHGGLYVRIDGDMLRRVRLEQSISLGALASELGVSRRTVSKYETESMDTSIEVAMRLEEIFNTGLIQAVDIFKWEGAEEETDIIDDNVLRHLAAIGFKVYPTSQAPFNAITQDKNMVVLTGVSKFTASMVKKARLMSSLSAVALTKSAVIVDGERKVERIDETVIIERRELDQIDKTHEFADLVMERRGDK